MPKDISIDQITALIDTRERTPWDLSPMPTVRAGLYSGDYSVAGLQSIIAIERKELADLIACCGRERERFERELLRLRSYPVSAVIVEATWNELAIGNWRSKLTPNHVLGSLTAWMARGHNIVLAGDRNMAQRICRSMPFQGAKYRWREAQSFIQKYAK